MQIEQIDTFLDLLETRSFHRSAERLGIAQSTVSARLRALEAALGQPLFERGRAGARPTPAGLRFREHALALRGRWREARREIGARRLAERTLRMGVQSDIAHLHLTALTAELAEARPQLSLYVEVDYSPQMIGDLLAGGLDLAALFTPAPAAELDFEAVGAIRYRMVATGGARRVSDIAPPAYIRANVSPRFDAIHAERFPELHFAPLATGHSPSVEGLLARLGGAAFVMESAVARLAETAGCAPVEDVEPIDQPVFAASPVRWRKSEDRARLLALLRRRLSAS